MGKKSPTHKSTAENRKIVMAMTSYGVPQEDISAVLDIDSKTLRKHYRKELDTATAKANAQVAQRLYQKALDGSETSMIFWLKTRAKWSERIEQQMLDANGEPADANVKIEFVDAKPTDS